MARELICALKFGRELAATKPLARLLLQCAAPRPRPDLLVPVPLTRPRLRQRGFDQALEIARPVGRALRIAVDPRCARRTVDRPPQSSLATREERARNVRGVFHVKPAVVEGRYVAVVDDVMTSTATCDSLTRALLRAGAARVDVWVCARAVPPPSRLG